MQDEKGLALFTKILQKTRSGELAWAATAAEGHFVAPLGEGLIVKIWPFTSIDERSGPEGPPSVGLVDENENLLVDLNFKIDGISPDELEEISSRAKRQALKIDQKIDFAIAQLDKLTPH